MDCHSDRCGGPGASSQAACHVTKGTGLIEGRHASCANRLDVIPSGSVPRVMTPPPETEPHPMPGPAGKVPPPVGVPVIWPPVPVPPYQTPPPPVLSKNSASACWSEKAISFLGNEPMPFHSRWGHNGGRVPTRT